MAVEFNGGVVIGADSRTTTGWAVFPKFSYLISYVSIACNVTQDRYKFNIQANFCLHGHESGSVSCIHQHMIDIKL